LFFHLLLQNPPHNLPRWILGNQRNKYDPSCQMLVLDFIVGNQLKQAREGLQIERASECTLAMDALIGSGLFLAFFAAASVNTTYALGTSPPCLVELLDQFW
jgi:hypothetical protein